MREDDPYEIFVSNMDMSKLKMQELVNKVARLQPASRQPISTRVFLIRMCIGAIIGTIAGMVIRKLT